MKLSLFATLMAVSFNCAFAVEKDFSLNNIERLHRGKNQIVLTFDDGPTPGVTNRILDTLKKHDIKATFFVIGSKVKTSPELMKRIKEEGHIAANHSMNHPKLGDLGMFSWKKIIKEEVLETHELMKPYFHRQDRFYFRAPHASWESKLSKYLNKTDVGLLYQGPVLWDIGGEMERNGDQITKAADWACWSKKWTVDECLEGYLFETDELKGGVVLMHDLVSKSAEMLEKLIPELKDRGYEFVTLDDVQF